MVDKARASHSILSLPASFVIGFVILYLRSALTITTIVGVPDLVDKVMLLAGSIFLVFHCIAHFASYKGKYIFAIVSICVGLICYVKSGESAAFVVVLTVLAAATVDDIDDVVRFWLGCTATLVVFLVLLFAIEMVIDPQSLKFIYRLSDDGVGRQRSAFFFSHPNMFGAIALMACSAFVYLRYDKLSLVHYFLVICVAGFVLVTSDSKTSFLLIVALVVLSMLQKSRGIFDGKRMRRMVGILPLVGFVAVLLVAGPLYSDSLGGLLTGRLSLWHACLENQGVTLLGQEFQSSTSVGSNGWVYYYTTLDCAYAQGLFVLGIAFSLWFSWAVWKCATCEELEPGRVLPALLVMFLFGITEVHVFTFAICYVILLLGKPILSKAPYKGGSRK